MSGELLSLSFPLQILSRYFFWWGGGGERGATHGKIRVNGKENGLREEKRRKKKKISVEEVLSGGDSLLKMEKILVARVTGSNEHLPGVFTYLCAYLMLTSELYHYRAFADFVFGSLILHFFCVNFIN